MEDYKLKLEIYKLTLNHKPEKVSDPCFRDLFNLQFNKEENEVSDEELLIAFNTKLSNKLNNEGGYIQIAKKSNKAFSIKELPNIDSKEYYTSGILKGGFKGDHKTLSTFNDKNESEPIDDKVINNQHFFFLYTPLNSNVGFLIFQSYPQENIRLDFLTFLGREIFKHGIKYNKIKAEPFLPNQIKEEYSKGATVSQITYSDRVLGSSLTKQSTIINSTSEYNIKVIIEPIIDTAKNNSLKVENLDKNFLTQISGLTALNKTLKSFKKTRGKIKKNGREIAFKIGGVNEILPIIQLGEEYIDNNAPNFVEIKKHCIKLMSTIKKEFYEKTKSKLIE